MKKLIISLFLSSFFLATSAQSLNLNAILKAYDSKSINEAFGILKNIKGFNKKTFLTFRFGDSTVVSHFGNDSLMARRQGKTIIIRSDFHSESEYTNLKSQASKLLKQIEIAPGKSMGETRLHTVYGFSNPLKKGDLELIITKTIVDATGQIYYHLSLLPHYY
jgi:hypothetical protein